MIPSSATPRRTSSRRRRNAAVGGTGATARALAAALWKQRSSARAPATICSQHGDGLSCRADHQKCNQRRTQIGDQCPCRRRRSRNIHHGIILDSKVSSSMDKATKWDCVYTTSSGSHLEELDDEDGIFFHPAPAVSKQPRSRSRPTVVALLESELDRARARIVELEDEKRVTSKRLERFLRKLEAEKSRVREDARLERRHRRELEAANARLLRELSAARQAAKQQSNSYEMERKARELMEEACSELTREVEEDQAEVELLRRECLRMREEMEEERRMLQMAEVWREERVQMKLSDAKLALEHKYTQLNRLQAEMEAFLSHRRRSNKVTSSSSDAARSLRPPEDHRHYPRVDVVDDDDDKVDADSVFEHFRRKQKQKKEMEEEQESSSKSNSNNLDDECASPATDLFLAKADQDDEDDPLSDEYEYDGHGSARGGGRGEDSCSCVGTSDPSVPVSVAAPSFPHNNGASRRSGTSKNTALIRRLWRSAITESRKKAGADECTPSGSGDHHRHRRYNKQSLKDKLMEARMKEKTPSTNQKH